MSATITCPRCKALACRVWRHQCNRFLCLGPCPPYDEAQCDSCEYPAPAGLRAFDDALMRQYPGGVPGDAPELQRSPLQSYHPEPLPPPFRGPWSR